MATPNPAPTPAPDPIPTPVAPPSIWSAFVDTLGELAGSKKFLVLLSSCIAWGALKLGWHVDQAVIDHYLMIASAFILAQGFADHGKGAAEVHAKLLLAQGAPKNANAAIPAGAGSARGSGAAARAIVTLLACGGLLVGAGSISGCGASQKWTGDFVTCAKADLGQIVGSNGPNLLADVAQLIEGNAPNLEGDLTALAVQFGIDAIECAIAATVTVLTPPNGSAAPPTGSGAAAAPVVLGMPPGVVRAVQWERRYVAEHGRAHGGAR